MFGLTHDYFSIQALYMNKDCRKFTGMLAVVHEHIFLTKSKTMSTGIKLDLVPLEKKTELHGLRMIQIKTANYHFYLSDHSFYHGHFNFIAILL